MLQRIQTVFLLLVIVTLGAFIFTPIWSVENPDTQEIHRLYALSHQYTDTSTNEVVDEYIPYASTALLTLIVIVIAAYEIKRYDNRLLQMKLSALNSLLLAGIIGLTILFATRGQDNWIPEYVGNYNIPGFYLPLIAMIWNILANRFIRRDEKLVRSVDRIR